MNRNCSKYWFAALAVLVATGCGPRIVFDGPQPEGAPDLKTFPQALQGKYGLSDRDTAQWVEVRPVEVWSQQERSYTFLRAELAGHPRFVVAQDQVFDKTYKRTYIAEVAADTLRFDVLDLKLEFGLGDSVKLRALSTGYVLNLRSREQQHWDTYLIAPTAPLGFEVYNLDPKDHLGLLRELGRVEGYTSEDQPTTDSTAVSYYLAKVPAKAWPKLYEGRGSSFAFKLPATGSD